MPVNPVIDRVSSAIQGRIDAAKAAGNDKLAQRWMRELGSLTGGRSPEVMTEIAFDQAAFEKLAIYAAQKVNHAGRPARAGPPAVTLPGAAASLARTSIPAAEQMETLLTVTHPGRFAIVANSPTGTALQLVDMLTGPSETVGKAGEKDGRLDLLLDVGTYKLRAFGAAQASAP